MSKMTTFKQLFDVFVGQYPMGIQSSRRDDKCFTGVLLQGHVFLT